MLIVVKRVIGALMALAGVALTALGAWFATQLGGEGVARFHVTPSSGTSLIVLRPDLLNRVPSPVQISATTTAGGTVWIGRAGPSDASAALGSAKVLDVTGVAVREWTLLTSTTGTSAAKPLGGADLWREQTTAQSSADITITQDHAPETVVIQATKGSISSLTAVWTRKTWFVESVVALIVGVFLAVAGGLLLIPRREHAGTPAAEAEPALVAEPAPVAKPAPVAEPVAVADTVDPAESTSEVTP